MAKLTENEAIELKLGLLLMSLGARLAIATKIAEEAREGGDRRWQVLKPQIQALRHQHNIVSTFLKTREGIDFTNPPDFIQEALHKPLMDTPEPFDPSSDLSDSLIEPQPVTIKCKPGKLGAKDGRRRHHSL